ncbi:MAG: 3-oxoacyl-ACP reductase family protein [Planctomycetota bacterium]|nr:3-oxoacyl-ACP reductase family protein [Planctomycetota bacterium]MDI6787420.1 3-oxoacyl-ACP reductase family protein [Planctomycetota bacterium]
MELANKGAIVTGGSVGIGAAIALDLARNGANVAINYRKHVDEANKIVEEIKKMGRKGLAIQADVTLYADAEKMVQSALKEFGRLDILVNNAGINQDAVVWKMTEEQWDSVMDINLKGCFNYIRAVAGIFKAQGHGRIVNITSINGLRGKFGQSNYSASKAGIIGLTKSVAREMGKFNININAVAPGLIETDMVINAPEEVRQKALAEIVLGRIGKPEEVASVVSFLCSEKARHITGEVIKVDGGQYI